MLISLVWKIIVVVCIFLYIYTVKLPIGNSRNVIIIIAFLFVLIDFLRGKFGLVFKLSRNLLPPLLFALMVSIISIITSIINQVYEPFYVNCFFSLITLMLSSWGLLRLMRFVYGRADIEILSMNIILAVYLQFILSLIMFFAASPIQELISQLDMKDETTMEAIESSTNRLHGVGANFFSLGVINCCAILLATAVLKHTKDKRLKKFYFISILIFLIVGMLMARTTLLSVPFIIFYYVYNNKRAFVNLSLSFVKLTVVLCLLLFMFQKSIISFLDENEMILRFGFEHFYNYFEGNGFSSDSTSELAELLVLPNNLTTWIIGDARIIDPNFLQYYYMNTDIGYCRALFYFGIVGLVPLLLLYFSLSKSTAKCCREYSFFFILLFLLFLLLFYKGICNILYWYCLFLFVENAHPGLNDTYPCKRR